MDDSKKSFFDLLDPKSALVVGLVGGLLSLGTLGFIVLGALLVQGKVNFGASSRVIASATPDQTQQATQPTQNTLAPIVPKSDKPKVDLYVMSYCPYGLQMEKAFVPAWNLLKNKAEISVKFVNYAMHGKKEVDENTRQYCIQSEQPTKFQAYLNCFFGAGQNDGKEAGFQKCLASTGVNQTSLNSCVARTDKQFGITTKFNDQSSWLSGQYPQYPIHDSENQQYGVQGSPTLVINGVQASAGRTPEAVKQAICDAFNNAPSECQQNLGNSQFQPGFGTVLSAAGGTAGANAPGCGT
jgi:protein-disulfide isomerase